MSGRLRNSLAWWTTTYGEVTSGPGKTTVPDTFYGPNAVDAVVATAVALGVVEPYMSGPGGVGFLLLHPADGHGTDGLGAVLNFSGLAPAAATAD